MEPEIVCEEITQVDLPPEYCRYEDEGCELSGSCLHCPFSHCVYERPSGKRHLLAVMRDREIIRLFHNGKDTAELARMFGVTRRTVQRIVKDSRKKLMAKSL